MAPGNNERHSSHTGTIPKTKVRNNSNVPQEVVTPTRREMTSNLVTTSLDWVPVSEYNTRTNYNQSRKPTNNSSDHELTDLDNSVSFESGFGRFVPVRPQPRALPLNVQNRENIPSDHNDDGTGSSISGHTLHPYSHHMQNGLISHSNHAAAAVMIVNPTTPNAVTGNMSQPFNTPNQNRNNLTRNLNRNNFEGNSHSSNNNTPPISNSKTGTKAVNLMNNMYDQGQGSFSNLNENNHVHRESARALGEAIVAACPDAAAVERRLGQIREYIRVTSSLVDTMRNSEDEAFIEHTKEEYDELVEMVMKLKESEDKLEKMLTQQEPENVEVPTQEVAETTSHGEPKLEDKPDNPSDYVSQDKTCNINNDGKVTSNTLKKITNIENEQLNKNLNNIKPNSEAVTQQDVNRASGTATNEPSYSSVLDHLETNEGSEASSNIVEIKEIETVPCEEVEIKKDDQHLNEVLRKNILSCVEKVALIEEMKIKNKDISNNESQDVIVRPVSVQSNGSAYSENELWQNEIKSKMELSQLRLAALKQQQKRLLKYQEEAKQQLEEMNRERQSQEVQSSTLHDNFNGLQNPSFSGNYHHSNRMYAANQIGVATTLPHSSEVLHGHQNISNNMENDVGNPPHSQEDRFSHREANIAIASSEEAAGARDSEGECEEEGTMSERARLLQLKLRELHAKKQHMESLVSEFQKLQMVSGVGSSRNTYSSSGEDSGEEETSRKCNKPGSNIKNEDPFKLMEIKAIKTALQKTKDLMRSVENYEANMLNTHDDSFQLPSHSNINDNKSDGGWSREGSVCRVRNALPPRHKLTNEHLHHHQQQQQQQQHYQQQQQQTHEANLASLQELAQELRMKTEKIMGERIRGKDVVSVNKGNVTEPSRKQKKVNEEVRATGSGEMGPAERRQMQLRALLADKQRELEALLNKEKIMCSSSENQAIKQDSCGASIVVNQSYNSEQDEPESRSEQILLDTQNSRDNDNFRGGGDSGLGGRSLNTLPSHLGSTYGSDSDSATRIKLNQRNRPRRRQPQDHQSDDNAGQSNSNQNRNHDSRIDVSNVNMVPPISQNSDSLNMVQPHLPPPCWNTTKSNQDMRTNQFTQNSHSQTMERLLGTPQMSLPPSMPFNMMMPFGMVGGCGCGCAVWGAWCWQQLAAHQRDIHQLRDQLNSLEERWRAETASHTLNNQVPPGNRANNYWDNFRSYSRQNLLSTNSKTNADGHLGVSPAHNPHPLVGRSHNALRRPAAPVAPAAKRNDEPPDRRSRRNLTCERSLSFSSAPDVLNVNQPGDVDANPGPAFDDASIADPPDLHLDRLDLRNLNVADPIPEIIQSHSNNLNAPANTKNKSSSKLPAKNSTNRRNYAAVPSRSADDVGRPSASTDPNLAPTDRDVREKAASKLFDLLRENVYSEVTALIGANESHPDFLIQLFRELQLISTDPLRRRVLQSIRSVLSQYGPIVEHHNDESGRDTNVPEAVTTSTGDSNEYREYDSFPVTNGCPSAIQIDDGIVRFLLLKSEEICTAELLEGLASHIINNVPDGRQTKKKLLEALSKYEGMRVCDVSTDIIDNLPLLISGNGEGDESTQHTSELSESSILQDVAGSLNLFSSSDTQLHQLNACPYEMWPGHVHMDIDDKDLNDNNSPRSSRESKVDLIDCSEMHNGELAEADQSCHAEAGEGGGRGDAPVAADALPDVVDTEEVTPTEAEAEWLGLDRVPTRLHLGESSEKQKD